MGYLPLTRREGDQIRLTIDPGVDTKKFLRYPLRDGISLHVGKAEAGRVSLGIGAPREVIVLREELEKHDAVSRHLKHGGSDLLDGAPREKLYL